MLSLCMPVSVFTNMRAKKMNQSLYSSSPALPSSDDISWSAHPSFAFFLTLLFDDGVYHSLPDYIPLGLFIYYPSLLLEYELNKHRNLV